MAASTSAVVLVTTATATASGSVDIDPVVKSTSALKNLTLFVVPIGDTEAQYTVTVTLDGETIEAHTFPSAGKTVAIMNYKDVIFPPVLGGDVQPAFAQANKNLWPINMAMEIQNLKNEEQVFKVYACFEDFDSFRSAPLSNS